MLKYGSSTPAIHGRRPIFSVLPPWSENRSVPALQTIPCLPFFSFHRYFPVRSDIPWRGGSCVSDRLLPLLIFLRFPGCFAENVRLLLPDVVVHSFVYITVFLFSIHRSTLYFNLQADPFTDFPVFRLPDGCSSA